MKKATGSKGHTCINAIVKHNERKNCERVNRRDFRSLLKDCAPDIHHRFGGSHAFGGERHDREALGYWLDRRARLGPNMRLTVQDVWVKGWSNDTTAAFCSCRRPLG